MILDEDFAELYGVGTGALTRAVRRNKDRFPDDFVFQLTKDEWAALRSQLGISNEGRGGRRSRKFRVPPRLRSLRLSGKLLPMSWGIRRIVGGVAAATALADLSVGMSPVASAGIVKYDTKLTISRLVPLYHGEVKWVPRKCERGRRVVLFERRPGRDRKVGRVRRKLNIVSADGYVCRAARSRTVAFAGD